ncbi:hypothetical protein PTKIN_Ptkin13bG0227300 [Pterospermum kingtungense]
MPLPNPSSVVSLLKVTPQDRKTARNGIYSSVFLPNLGLNDHGMGNDLMNGRESREKDWKNGVIMVLKDPENLREFSFREFGDLVTEENEVTEQVLVRDVLYACQGIDGKFVKFDSNLDAYALPDLVKGVGTVGQAFFAALQDELSEYYKLLAVLEAQSMNPIPLGSENASSGNYMSLRRLSVWFAEPKVKMRLMAVLVDKCQVLRGGAMAGAIHLHAQHGDPLVRDFMRQLLRRVCSPLFEMVRSWVLEGELEDIFAEFFIVEQPVKTESLWREGYRLHSGRLPLFVSHSLAQCILRIGKSINFLRVCCDVRDWSDAAAAAGTTTRRGGLGYGETDALESLVMEAAKRIDKHLLDVICKSWIMESAIRSSNAQYDNPDILDRLRVKMMPPGSSDGGWDVFSLEYDARVPLDTVFTGFVMIRYLRIFNFLWKLRRVEHALIAAWKTMKPNCITSYAFTKLQRAVKLQLHSTLRRCQNHADRLYDGIYGLQARTADSSLNSQEKNKSRRQTKDKSSEPGSWISEGRKALTQHASEFLQNMGQDLDTLATEYKSLVESFLSQLPVQQHIDLKFLLFRLDFNELYSRQHPLV